MIPQIRFTNNQGTVQIAGGLSPLLSPTFISGLTLPERETKTAVFKNIAGQKLISLRDLPRNIEINGKETGDLKKVASIMYSSGVLTFETDRMKRVIAARCTYISDRNTDGRITLKFECDNPYFHDGEDLRVSVYSRIKLVKTPFTLPCIFTTRVREGNCKNESSVYAEPEIILKNKGEAKIEGFTLTNTDTGAVISMYAEIPVGGEAKINIKERTALNSAGENLLPFLSETSYLHEFILAPGDNRIVLNASDGLECEIVYNTNYTEAVI